MVMPVVLCFDDILGWASGRTNPVVSDDAVVLSSRHSYPMSKKQAASIKAKSGSAIRTPGQVRKNTREKAIERGVLEGWKAYPLVKLQRYVTR